MTLFKGHRQNEVEVQPNWFINRKAEFSLAETVANRKGFRRSEKKSSHWLKQLANGKSGSAFRTLSKRLRRSSGSKRIIFVCREGDSEI